MSIIIGLDAQRLEFAKDEIVVGRGATADVSLPQAVQLDDRHAVIRKVAGRWLIEAQQERMLRVGDGRPTKMAWLTAGDVIHLTDNGPLLTFEPPVGASATPAVKMPVVEVLPEDPESIRIAAPLHSQAPAPTYAPEAILIPPELAAQFDDGDELPPKRPKRAKPAIADAVPSVSQPTTQNPWKPIALAAAAVVVIFAAWKSLSPPSQPQPNLQSSPEEEIADQTPPLVVGNSPPRDETRPPQSTNQPRTTAKSPSVEQLKQAVYLVLLSAPDRDQTYRLGTAWAIDRRRLLTSAAVGQGVLQLREQLPQITVRGSGEASPVTISQVRIHPEFLRIGVEVAAAQAELDELQDRLAGDDEAEPVEVDEETRNKLAAAQDKLLQSLQQQLDFDVAVLDVDRDLPTTFPSATNAAGIRPGASVRMLGIPFPVDEFLVDPDAPLEATAVTGQMQAKVATDDQGLRRWLVKLREAKPSDNWSGAAVVNSRGEIIGVYSRPTPPPTLLDDDYVPSTHEVISIDRMKDIQ